MKSIKKILSIILIVITVSCLFSGCHSNNETIDFIYPIEGEINSFDPQIAATGDEFIIAENCYEGLVRVLDNGSIQPGVAESWSISSDNLTYTFNLRQGAKWRVTENGYVADLMGEDFNPDITANDFVFALRRACDPNTNAPLFSSIASIKNATDIHSGKASIDKLGVTATDEYTLVITLASADEGFMTALSTSIAMPCNEDFFNATKGRYGLGLKYSMFNGQFFVSSVLEASYILKNNSMYVGEYPSKVTDITLSIINAETDIPKNVKSGYFDCAYMTGMEYERLNDDNVTVLPYTNKMWGIVLNNNRQLFINDDLRQAICLSISVPEDLGHSFLTRATGITPPSCTIEGSPANEVIGSTAFNQDSSKAIELWRKGLEEERFTSASITVITTEDMENLTKQLVQGIQGSIGTISSYGDDGKIAFSLKIEVLNEEDYRTALANGDYDLALRCFSASNQNTNAYLDSVVNSAYVGDAESINKLMDTLHSSTTKELPAACKNVETEIINNHYLVPIAYESSYYAQAKGVSGVNFHAGSGRISFINANRED